MNVDFFQQAIQLFPKRAKLRRFLMTLVFCGGLLGLSSHAAAQTSEPDVVPQPEASKSTPSVVIRDWFEELFEASSKASESQVIRPNEFDVSQLSTSMLELLRDTYDSLKTNEEPAGR